MFLCEDDHDKDCPLRWIEDLGSGSYGRCEACGLAASCVDCHGYKHLSPGPAVGPTREDTK